MSEYEHSAGRPASSAMVERLFVELDERLELAALLYANACWFDPERARRMRHAFDARVGRAEILLQRDAPLPAPLPTGGANRAQRIESEITAFIADTGKPVTIDDVLEHLVALSLGEPRASLITRMSRMAASGRLMRSGRGYYELGADA